MVEEEEVEVEVGGVGGVGGGGGGGGGGGLLHQPCSDFNPSFESPYGSANLVP